ncbi:hypothetical protein F6X40_35720 [Paraburkholderia sp. UCT31]|uniref:hypothetical protein n=1 Tax=Paraburkholderia sp. UCT31 TaxID=2615209 RepID=UPI00165618ED|nr:hypothetical protein [Paraburkholderia sp. UCT31]MBC8741900.1 hypothetical protein [Paraburkholderia sp. UCT31]
MKILDILQRPGNPLDTSFYLPKMLFALYPLADAEDLVAGLPDNVVDKVRDEKRLVVFELGHSEEDAVYRVEFDGERVGLFTNEDPTRCRVTNAAAYFQMVVYLLAKLPDYGMKEPAAHEEDLVFVDEVLPDSLRWLAPGGALTPARIKVSRFATLGDCSTPLLERMGVSVQECDDLVAIYVPESFGPMPEWVRRGHALKQVRQLSKEERPYNYNHDQDTAWLYKAVADRSKLPHDVAPAEV